MVLQLESVAAIAVSVLETVELIIVVVVYQ